MSTTFAVIPPRGSRVRTSDPAPGSKNTENHAVRGRELCEAPPDR